MFPLNVVAAAAGQEQLAAYTITAGTQGGQVGFNRPFGQGILIPDVPLFGDFILEQEISSAGFFFFSSSPQIQPDTDEAWQRTEITGTFANGAGTMIYIRANRTTYTPVTGAVTQWEFGLNALGALLDGNIYDVKTFRP